MKKFFLSLCICSTSCLLFADGNGLSEARKLAEMGIIVDQSSLAPQYGVTTSTDIQESALYRVDDFITRQEVLGIALKLKNVILPDGYVCRDFFRDTGEWWVCRAAELSSDHGIVTRANLYFRPRSILTLGEALGIVIKAQDIPLSTRSTNIISGSLPDWQKRLILTIQDQNITLNIRDEQGRGIALYDGRVGISMSGFDMSHRMRRGEFFQLIVAFLDHEDTSNPFAHCSSYTNGCNDCSRDSNGLVACDKRLCVWQGIPKCYACDSGYTLENDRCVKKQIACIQEGKYAGGGYVMYPENPSDFVCCTGLKNARHKDGNMIADVGNVCIREGDDYCDARYESEYNSLDCRSSCKKEGESVSNGSLPPQYQYHNTCCSGLTEVAPKEEFIVGASNICANVGDGYCDARYESAYNSADCGASLGFDSSICQSYYDGCNSCSKTENGQTICTMRACLVNGPAYCTSYVPYVPKTQTADSTFLSKIESEIRNYTKDISCTINAQCQWSMIGYRACGGPTKAIAYSMKNINETLLSSKGTYYTNAEKKFNEYYGIISDCMYMMPPPEPRCINGTCQ